MYNFIIKLLMDSFAAFFLSRRFAALLVNGDETILNLDRNSDECYILYSTGDRGQKRVDGNDGDETKYLVKLKNQKMEPMNKING